MCLGCHGCMVTMALGFVMIWFGFSEVVPELSWYSVMSHLLLLNGHSQDPMRMHHLVELVGCG